MGVGDPLTGYPEQSCGTVLNTAPSIRELISAEAIHDKVVSLGCTITRDYPDADAALLLVGVLKGGAMFASDLLRQIRRPLEIDFVAFSSYGAGTETLGQVRILKDLDTSAAGKHVIIVEDILDTGLTLHLSGLVQALHERGARSVRICALLDKPSRRRVDVSADYCGFTIGDEFVVGYGMDFAERYRNLPYVGVLEPARAAEPKLE